MRPNRIEGAVIVGIDIGGTKTHILIEDEGRVVLDRSLPTGQWQRGQLLDDEQNTTRLLATFAEIAGSDSAPLVIGAHGLDSDWQTSEFNSRVVAHHGGPVRTLNDVELLAPAAGIDEAIAVIVGTGSKVIAHGPDGAMLTAGGYGFLLNDPGSAPAIAREAVKAVLEALDHGRAPDALGRALMSHFGVEDEVAMSYAFAANVGLAAWGALAPAVFSAADAGSELAIEVVDGAARELARGVGLVVARGAIGADVVCAGGVITNQPRLWLALNRHIDDLELGLRVHLLTVAPVIGAVALARELLDSASIDESWRTA